MEPNSREREEIRCHNLFLIRKKKKKEEGTSQDNSRRSRYPDLEIRATRMLIVDVIVVEYVGDLTIDSMARSDVIRRWSYKIVLGVRSIDKYPFHV